MYVIYVSIVGTSIWSRRRAALAKLAHEASCLATRFIHTYAKVLVQLTDPGRMHSRHEWDALIAQAVSS